MRVGAVNYLNTKPLIYGFQQGVLNDKIELVMEYPSRIASMLIDDSIDIGLIPVAAIPLLDQPIIISDFCIGCDGEVASVCLFSEVPLQEIETILLDYQSLTSVALLRILISDYWKITPLILETNADYRKQIKGKVAGLVIGDRAFEQRKISPFIFDLGYEWKKYTGYSFVFAAWVSNKPMDNDFIAQFNAANRIGLDSLDLVVIDNPYGLFDLKLYYKQYISYLLDQDKKIGMALFMDKLRGVESPI